MSIPRPSPPLVGRTIHGDATLPNSEIAVGIAPVNVRPERLSRSTSKLVSIPFSTMVAEGEEGSNKGIKLPCQRVPCEEEAMVKGVMYACKLFLPMPMSPSRPYPLSEDKHIKFKNISDESIVYDGVCYYGGDGGGFDSKESENVRHL